MERLGPDPEQPSNKEKVKEEFFPDPYKKERGTSKDPAKGLQRPARSRDTSIFRRPRPER